MEKLRAIVLGTVKYSDSKNIIILYTRERGRVTVMSAAGGSRGGKMRNARLMPLSAVQAEVRFRETRDIQTLGQMSPLRVWRNIYADPVRSAVVMFLSEFLDRLLRESQPDPTLWDYLLSWLDRLDEVDASPANMHIAILIGLLPYMGISPDLHRDPKWGGAVWFDMREGTLTPSMPLHNDMLPPEEVAQLSLLMRMTSANCRAYKMKGTDRSRCLEKLLHYYAVHFPGLSNLKSPEVLAAVFQ